MMTICWRAGLLAGCVMALAGCDDEPAEVAETDPPAAAEQPAEQDEAPSEPEPTEDRLGTVNGAPFVVRGVFARRFRESDPTIEVRLFERPVDCDFDVDRASLEDEPIVVIYVRWPRSAGDTVPLRASETEERFQFCHGRASGRTLCSPRAPEQGSLSVVEAADEGGTLSLHVSTDEGSLSGEVEFTICEPS